MRYLFLTLEILGCLVAPAALAYISHLLGLDFATAFVFSAMWFWLFRWFHRKD